MTLRDTHALLAAGGIVVWALSAFGVALWLMFAIAGELEKDLEVRRAYNRKRRKELDEWNRSHGSTSP